jgi:CDP-diacylglycerol--glycerol-3-phosphate 3-phosphatidyltransferase/cardiolipin synthase
MKAFGWLAPRGAATGRSSASAAARRGRGFALRELLLLPNVLSLLRIPLALAFPFVAASPALSLAVLAAAGATDVFDGWVARRLNQVTATGAIVDPIADKAFAVTVVVTLLARHDLPAWAVVPLLARELFEAPLLAWVFLTGRHRGARLDEAAANVPGKAATIAQFAAVMSAIALPRALPALLLLASVAGAGAGVAYWLRELGRGGAAPRV